MSFIINPKTGRKVKIGSKTYSRLVRDGTLPNTPFDKEQIPKERKLMIEEKKKTQGNEIQQLLNDLRILDTNNLDTKFSAANAKLRADDIEKEPAVGEDENVDEEEISENSETLDKDLLKELVGKAYEKLLQMEESELDSLDDKKIRMLVESLA